MKNCILVTGGTGYIGSHTVVELLRENFKVIIIDNLSNSEIETVAAIEKITGKRPEFEKIDLCDVASLKRFFQKNSGIDAVIHFAALKAVGESGKIPLAYYHNNINSTVNLLEMMLANRMNHIVFSSSCTVYGEPDIFPVTESAPLKPAVSVYGNTKKICEDIIRDITRVSDISAISLRYFNPAGAHSSGLIGDSPLKPSDNLVPAVTQTAAGRRKMLCVYGNDYDTPDGTCVRDYIHVTDLAKAHVSAIKRLIGKKNKNACETFNLGSGKGFSVMEIINAFMKATGVKLKYKITGRRHGDVSKVFAGTSLAARELNWKPELSLDDIMRTAWQWEKKKDIC